VLKNKSNIYLFGLGIARKANPHHPGFSVFRGSGEARRTNPP